MTSTLFDKYSFSNRDGSIGVERIKMIKELRELTGFGLVMAKDICDKVVEEQGGERNLAIMKCKLGNHVDDILHTSQYNRHYKACDDTAGCEDRKRCDFLVITLKKLL